MSVGVLALVIMSLGPSNPALATTSQKSARAHAADFEGTQTITFEEFPVGTEITDQYEGDGVLFSGESLDEPPFITEDESSDSSPVLSGSPRFSGAIHAQFVTPGTSTPASVNGLAVDVGYINDPGSVHLVLETAAGTETIEANEFGIDHLESSASGISGFTVEQVGEEDAGWEIDNVSFNPAASLTSPPPPPPPPPPAATPPPPAPFVDPCVPEHGSIGSELLRSIKCTAHETKLEVECGVAVASLIILPLKSLKLVEAARSIDVIDKLPSKTRPTARFIYDVLHSKISPHAPPGFRTDAELLDTLDKVKKAYQLIALLPDFAKAFSHADYSQLALDLDNIAGLKPCVEGVAEGLAG